jgi:phenylacetate-coenzyme A ligase PaaK-like adenylate-forming protein
MDGLRNFWAKLLPLTIAHAVERNSFYGDLLSDVDAKLVCGPNDLKRLPIVTREMLRDAGSLAVSSGLACVAIQNTSGTTGDCLFLHRSAEEFSFIGDFFESIIRRNDAAEMRPLTLIVDTNGHGVHTPVPSRSFVLHSDIGSTKDIRRAVAYLSRVYDIAGVESRVSALVGGLAQVNLLTEFLLTNGLINLVNSIKSLSLTSDFLSPANRIWLETHWPSANVIDRYSMAECFGGATYCSQCKGFHFDPVIVPELVPLNASTDAQAQQGRLVVTALFPFVQMQPLIRYQTDDLFAIAPSMCGRPNYLYLGRINHSLIDPLDEAIVLIPGAYLFAALDETLGVARRGTLGRASGAFYGKPIVSGRRTINGAKRSFCLTTVIDAQADAETVANDLSKHLRERCVELDRMILAEEIELTVRTVREDAGENANFDRETKIWTD